MDKQLCLICGCQLDKDTIELTCKHKFDRECFYQYLENIIGLNTEKLRCPQDQCEVSLDPHYLKTVLDGAFFKRLEDCLMRRNQVVLNKNEIMIDCINHKCQVKLIVWKDADYTTCYQCNLKMCLKCRQPSHESLTCAEAIKISFRGPDLETYRDMIAKGFKTCPHCQQCIEKVDGCNFIRCPSDRCIKEKSFCYQCNEKLVDSKDHFDHYMERDPYKGLCKVRGENGNWIQAPPAGTDQNTKIVTKPMLNSEQCPGCGTLDPNKCEILPNFNMKVCHCQSEKCKKKYYCLKCRYEVAENQFMDHFNAGKGFECRQKCSIF